MNGERRYRAFLAVVALGASAAAAPALGSEISGAAPRGPAESARIVFARSTTELDLPEATEIFAIDSDGTDVTQLTDNGVEDAFPVLSPDGARIAFVRFRGGNYELFAMDADGTNVERLTRTERDEALPAWSPNGRRLVYTELSGSGDGFRSDLAVLNLTTGRTTPLVRTRTAQEFAPEWSPDGDLIAFTRLRDDRARLGVGLVDVGTGEVSWLVINPLSESGYTDASPSWSPDGEWVAFQREHGADPFVDLFKVRRDGSEVTAITEINTLAENPSWGPDGLIAFMHDEAIAIVAEDGTGFAFVTPTRTGLPHWWPDW